MQLKWNKAYHLPKLIQQTTSRKWFYHLAGVPTYPIYVCHIPATLKKKTTQPLSTCCGEDCRIGLTYPMVHLGPRIFARMQACHMTITFTNKSEKDVYSFDWRHAGHIWSPTNLHRKRVPMCIDIHRLFPQQNGFLLTGFFRELSVWVDESPAHRSDPAHCRVAKRDR